MSMRSVAAIVGLWLAAAHACTAVGKAMWASAQGAAGAGPTPRSLYAGLSEGDLEASGESRP